MRFPKYSLEKHKKILELAKMNDNKEIFKIVKVSDERRPYYHEIDFDWLYPRLVNYHTGCSYFLLGIICHQALCWTRFADSVHNGNQKTAYKYFRLAISKGYSEALYWLLSLASSSWQNNFGKLVEKDFFETHNKIQQLKQENEHLRKENEKLKTELECVPEYGKAYLEAKERFEKTQKN